MFNHISPSYHFMTLLGIGNSEIVKYYDYKRVKFMYIYYI